MHVIITYPSRNVTRYTSRETGRVVDMYARSKVGGVVVFDHAENRNRVFTDRQSAYKYAEALLS